MADTYGHVSSLKTDRKRAFSCESCRKRKVKCDGRTPVCTRCSTRGDLCQYEMPPTLAYTKALERKVAELESKVRSLESSARSPDATSPGQTTGQFPPTVSTFSLEDNIDGTNASQFKALQIDDGHLTFHGTTSFFHLPKTQQGDAGALPVSPPTKPGGGKDKLINSAWKERAFEQFSNTPEPMRSLLRDHWTWIWPLFNFVYRPAFTRDIKTHGPYYSVALHNTILAHSVRWARADPAVSGLLEPYDQGTKFYRQAIAAIFDDVKQGPGKIPDIQALLLLSAQATGKGHRTQAWLYTGMAIRLVEDMGLNVDPIHYAATAGLSDEDIEIRNRLFWSCYAWEKLLCLYLGRQPSISTTHASPPSLLLDDSAEIEVWTPSGMGVADVQNYPPEQSHATSCFINMCSLSEILHRILTQMYDPFRNMSEQAMAPLVSNEETNLQSWWDRLPIFLKLADKDLPTHCPPAHIATLNAIFYMVKIQLHRPVLCARDASEVSERDLEHHVSACSSSATNIINIFDLYTRTFGTGHIMTVLLYCLYTAASIFLLQIQAAGHASPTPIKRLKYCIDAMVSARTSAPIINPAIKLIEREVETLGLTFDMPTDDPPDTLELPRMVSEEPNMYEWSAVGPESSILPQQWGDIAMSDQSDTIFDEDFFLAADVHPSSYFTYDFPDTA